MAASKDSLDDALQTAVHSTFPGVRISRQETIQSLWGGYGKIVRVYLQGDNEAPRSVVVKCVIPPQHEQGISHERKCKSYRVEQFFYDHYASKLNPSECRVPALLCSDTSNPNRTLFVLEDLDDVGFGQRRYNLSVQDARLCVQWLASFHKTFLNTITSNNEFGSNGVWEQGSYWHLETRPDEFDDMDDRDPLKKHAKAIDQLLRNAKFKTLLHGDAKLANFCWSETGKNELSTKNCVAAVDFQYTGWGVGVIDLAYCIGHFPGVHRLDQTETELLDYYFECLDADIEVEEEWRRLYCVAVADFERFLAGWASSPWNRKGEIANKVSQAIALL